jgi:2-succinyl-6-hydroxy-2,4-cyclohexadiene-1-carboxylate synthase
MAGLARPLRAAGLPVLAPDLPGHGGSPVPAGGATLSAAVAAALAALDRRGLGRAHWVGYSLGGRVALAAALDHPERCASLVLVGATAGIEDDQALAARGAADEALAGELEAGGLAAFVDRWMAQELFASQGRLGHRGLRAARSERLRGSASGYAASLRGMGQGVQPSFWARLGEVEVPVLLVVGEEDGKYGEVARAMADRMAGARVAVVPGAGHAAHVEAPGAVGELVLGFLRAAEVEQRD